MTPDSSQSAGVSTLKLEKLSEIHLRSGEATFIVHDKGVQFQAPKLFLGVIAHVDRLYRLDDAGLPITYVNAPDNMWVVRDLGRQLRAGPVSGQPEMVQYQATLAPGAYTLKTSGTSATFTVDGSAVGLDHCVDTYQWTRGNLTYIKNGDAPEFSYRACDTRPNAPSPQELVISGKEWFAKKELGPAIRDLTEAINAMPTLADAYDIRGRVWRFSSRVDKVLSHDERAKTAFGYAMSDFNEAIAQNPKFAVAYDDRGTLRNDDPDGSLSDFNMAIDADPNYALAYRHRGEFYLGRYAQNSNAAAHDLTDFNRARSDLAQAIQIGAGKNSGVSTDELIDSYDSQMQAYHIVMYYEKKTNFSKEIMADLDGIIDIYIRQSEIVETARKESTGSEYVIANAYHDRGNIRSKVGQYELAIADFQKALEIVPNYLIIIMDLAKTYEKVGKVNDASATYKRVLSVNPNFKDAQDGLKRIGAGH